MNEISFDGTTGTWVRLVRDGATMSLERWPGPHGPGHVIHTSDGERFSFDRFERPADGIPEAVYVATRADGLRQRGRTSHDRDDVVDRHVDD